MLFTTSWDDGYALDLRIAEMLFARGLTGTFYVCPKAQHDRPMLPPQVIKDLSGKFEIGAHTMSHAKLTVVDLASAKREITESKRWIESISGKPCEMFCYPFGALNPAVQALASEAGFTGARTTQTLRFSAADVFALPVSLQVSPFPLRRSFRPLWKLLDPLGPLRAQWGRLSTLGVPLVARCGWLSLAKALFLRALQTKQPFFHLYGHSHEIERYGMWNQLDDFLRFVKQQSSIEPVTNGTLASRIS